MAGCARSAGGLDEPGFVTAGFWRADQPRWLHVSPKRCSDLQALIDTRQPNGQRAFALTTILHERIHAQDLSRRYSEAQTNCYAVQLVRSFARELSFTPSKALRLETLAVRKTRAVSPRPLYWHSGLCRDGESWDLVPEFDNLNY